MSENLAPLRRIRTALLAAATSIALAVVAVPAGPVASAHAATDDALRIAIRSLMTDASVQPGNATVGVAVWDQSARTPIHLQGQDTQLAPASSLKVLTAAAAATYLGTGYRWATRVLTDGTPVAGRISGNVYLQGKGDPTLLTSHLSWLAGTLRSQGITSVSGSVVADASFFDDVRWNPNWDTRYASEYYGAQISALTLAPDTDYDTGTVIVTATPTGPGQPPRLSVTPPEAAGYVTLVNRMTTGARGTGASITASRALGTNTVTVSGTVPSGGTARRWVTIDNPARYTAHIFRTIMQAKGIAVTGGVTTGRTPAGASLRVTHWSMPLSQQLVPMLKLSNNGHADMLTKTLGTLSGRPGNWADGTAQLRRFMERMGIGTSRLSLVDGSGLARANRATAWQLSAFMALLPREPVYASIRSALPVAGADPVRWVGGTLSSRMRGTAAAGNLRAKNGALTGVSSLTGEVTGANGRRYAFSIVSNYWGPSPRSVEDRLGVLLAGWR